MADTAAQEILSDPKAYHWRESAPKRTPSAARKRLLELIDSENIAEEMGVEELGRLGQKVLREFEVDKNSRSDWEETNREAMDMAKQVVEEKNYPWPKAANIKYPLLTTAAIQFAARAYPAIISGPGVVKGRVRGKDDGIPLPQPAPFGLQPAGTAPEGAGAFQVPQGAPIEAGQPMAQISSQQGPQAQVGPQMGVQGTGEAGVPQQGPQAPQQPPQQQWLVEPGSKKKRADRVGRHMSYQLLDEMEEWEPETDKLLHIIPIVGCAFRKSWYSPSLGRNVSELVLAEDFVVNWNTKSLDTCPRATHVIRLYPHEVEERIRDERFIEFDLGQVAGSEPNDEDGPHEFLEQYRLEDFDEDGYPEPYTVTVHKETAKVVRIVARFGEDDVQTGDDGKVTRIEAVQYFTKFGFLPSLDGGFYDMGFGTLIQPLSSAIDSSINQMLDAGHLQNTGGGFIGSGLRIKGGDTRFRPGEYKRVISIGGAIKDNIVALPWPGPSMVLFQLLGLLIEAARDITSVKDIMTGDSGPPGEGAARTMARIEQGMKVFSSIYKRLFRSLKSEFKKLARLNRLYLEDDTYFTLLDDPEAIAPSDYNFDDLDILPVADPNMVTETQRMAQAEFLTPFMNDPHVDPLEVRKRIFGAVGIPDVDDLLREQPPPDPKLAQAADEIEVKKREVEIKAQQLELDKPKVEAEARKLIAQAAESQSKTILNLANAEAVSDSVEIEALKLMSSEACEQLRYRLEAGKAMDAREANERKATVDKAAAKRTTA